MTTVTKPTNVRAEAQIADNIIATIMPGAAVEVVYKMEKWTQVHITINGYIANSLLVDESTFTWEAWPLPNRDTADINQPFGANPDRYAEFNLPGHEGIDLAAETGEPIAAVADGIIHRIHNLHAGYHNYGNHVRITHMDGLDRKSTRLNSSPSQISYAVFFFNDTATPEIYPLSLHDALPILASFTAYTTFTPATTTTATTSESHTWTDSSPSTPTWNAYLADWKRDKRSKQET